MLYQYKLHVLEYELSNFFDMRNAARNQHTYSQSEERIALSLSFE